MITLITGAPGSGKTLYTVDKLLQPLVGTTVKGQDEDGNTVEYPRTIYSNINGLLIDHELIDAEWLQALHENKTTGAVVVFDEVQRVWPNRPTGSKKPAAVEYLETHRHDGIDLIIMTQNPQLLDPAVRALVGRHLHMRRVGSMGAAIVYEWDACSNALNFKGAFTKHPYRYSRKAQQLYRSAKVHTKQQRRLPFVFWMFVVGLAGALYMWPNLMSNITSKGNKQPAQSSQQPASTSPAPAPAPAPVPASAPNSITERVRAQMEWKAQFVPRQDGMPHTAPRYDHLTQPAWVPYPAICVSTANACRCYDQRGNRLDTPDMLCRDYADRGYVPDFLPDGSEAPAGAQLIPPARARTGLPPPGPMVSSEPSRVSYDNTALLAYAAQREGRVER